MYFYFRVNEIKSKLPFLRRRRTKLLYFPKHEYQRKIPEFFTRADGNLSYSFSVFTGTDIQCTFRMSLYSHTDLFCFTEIKIFKSGKRTITHICNVLIRSGFSVFSILGQVRTSFLGCLIILRKRVPFFHKDCRQCMTDSFLFLPTDLHLIHRRSFLPDKICHLQSGFLLP